MDENETRGPDEPQAEMSYRDYCDWFAMHGDPAQEAADSEYNAAFDDDRERYAGSRLDREGELDAAFPPF